MSISKLKEIKVKYELHEIDNFQDEDMFMDSYVELLKSSIQLLYHIVDFKYCDEFGEPKLINKEEAVLGGNLTRLIKLNTSFLQNVCEKKLEICHIINRCIAETSINIKYMLLESEERVKRNYIKHSLITEKELWQTILSNVKERNDEKLPIEERMQKSIEYSFDKSDFEIDDVNKSSKWKSIKSRADEVAGEMFYGVFYGIASHSIHGNWQDILYNNLIKYENGFKLNLKWNNPKPQIIEGAIVFNLDIVNVFSDLELKENVNNNLLKEKVKMLFEYYEYLSNKHEAYLTNKTAYNN